MNKLTYQIKGRAYTVKINNMIRKNFHPYNIVCRGKILTFDINADCKKDLEAHFDDMGYRYKLIKISGLQHNLKSFINKKSYFIGVIASILLLIISTFFVFDIKISGCKQVDRKEIYKVLKANGVGLFRPIIYVTGKEEKVKADLIQLEGVSHISYEIRGVKLYINVKEEMPQPQVVDFSKDLPVNASKNAVVTRIVVLSGTSLVKVGDSVFEGNELIAPYYTNKKGDEEVDEEIRVPIKATGMVYGRCWYSDKVEIKATEVVKKRTGKVFKDVQVDYILDFKSKPKIPFKQYEKETKIETFNCVLPLKLTYTNYYEIKDEEVHIDLSKVDYEQKIIDTVNRLKEKVPKDAKILKYWYIRKEVDNTMTIDVYLETEQRIDGGGNIEDNNN